MRTIQGIKDEVSKSFGYKSWEELKESEPISNTITDAIAKAYALQVLLSVRERVTAKEESVSNSIDAWAHGLVEGYRQSRFTINETINELKEK